MNRTDRLLAIVLELQAKGWQRAEDLAATFEVSKRTMYRDLMALSESGVPLVASPGKGYTLDEGYFLPPLHFTPDEATILLLGTDVVTQTFDHEYQRASRSAATKIAGVLNEAQRAAVEPLRASLRYIAINPFSDDSHADYLRRLRQAILDCRMIHFVYHTRQAGDAAGEINARDADPYALAYYARAWYLRAYCHLRRDIRSFRIDRMEGLEVLNRRFRRPDESFARFTNASVDRDQIVRVVFTPQVARWAQEERPFWLIEADEQPDGLYMTLGVRRIDDVVQWLMGWGANVRVIEPEALRERLVREARALLEVYETSVSAVE